MKKLAILNTTIITADGTFELRTISLEEAKLIVNKNKNNILSAVGHESTAKFLSLLLKTEINSNRIEFTQETKQSALCFKLKKRPPEGKILTKEDLIKIGFEFKLLFRSQ